MVLFLANGNTITVIYLTLLLKKLGKFIELERRGMLTRNELTPAGQLPSFHNSYVFQTEAQSCGYESFLTILTLPTLQHLTSIFPTMKSFVKESCTTC